MTFLNLDDGFCEHPKISRLSHQAFRLHVTGLVYCARNLTDGHVSKSGLPIVFASARVRAPRYLTELVQGGLWTRDRLHDGYWIHDYLEHNYSASEVKERRAVRAAAGRKGGVKSGQSRRHKLEANAEANASRLLEPYPIPSHPHSFSYESLPSYVGQQQGANLTIRGGGGQPLDKLHRAVGGSPEALTKLRRTWPTPTDAALIAALEACTGPNVLDPLAVALSELKKRRPTRRTTHD